MVGLKNAEAICDGASNGLIALSMVKDDVKKNNGKLSYSIILMDFNMPVMDGVTCSRKIREFLYEEKIPQPIIVGVTGHTEVEYALKAIENGVNMVLQKPIKGAKLKPIF